MFEEVIKVYFVDGSWKSVKLNPKETTVEELWEVIGDKLGFTVEEAQCFFIWGCEDDLELLLYANSTIKQVQTEWPKYMQKWSNKEKKFVQKRSVKGFHFLFKPTSIVQLNIERKIKHPEGVNLFYIEAVYNVVTSNYPCELETAITLAGLQAHVSLGERNPAVHKPGYLKKSILGFVPQHLHNQKKIEEWEMLIYKEQDKHKGKDKFIAKLLYLQIVRQWPFYGCTFFSARYTPASQGFYEQVFSGRVVIGVNYRGVHVMDPIVKKVISTDFEQLVDPKADKEYLEMWLKRPDSDETRFICKTKQGDLICDLIYDWWAEYKRERNRIQLERQRQEAEMAAQNLHQQQHQQPQYQQPQYQQTGGVILNPGW